MAAERTLVRCRRADRRHGRSVCECVRVGPAVSECRFYVNEKRVNCSRYTEPQYDVGLNYMELMEKDRSE
ncbi:hypothetical protein EXN66_Car009769 [Channa argus]|uniref:Uncharacterized protein n=1 Tax=Channa argus TaxID=215402 RepID=A0A6G1PV84_CHAAH|nr:hypothetical protein EXN66_Car009769 [Channa argus]